MAKPSRRRKKYESDSNESYDNIVQIASKRFTPKSLASLIPKTEKQKQFFEAYQQDYPVIVQLGAAGTGKSMCALWAALNECLEEDSCYSSVTIIRSAVETRSQGFLPGTLEEKEAVYELPYRGIIGNLFSTRGNQYDNLKSTTIDKIRFMTTSFLRGQTFEDTIVFVDEVANMDYEELATIMTRLGKNTRVVFAGDFKQCDLQRKREKSGLGKFIRVLENMPKDEVAFIEYGIEDVVRSGIARSFLVSEYSLDE